MSNCEYHDLPLIELEAHQVSEVLRCILHTIIFNRALGAVSPIEVDSELFDLTWVTCGDEAVDKRVESKVADIQTWIRRAYNTNTNKTTRPQNSNLLQINLSFFERRHPAGTGWFSRQEQRLYWEQWAIHLALQEEFESRVESARVQRRQALQGQLTTVLTAVITAANKKRDHIPPVVSGIALTFPFDVTLDSSTLQRKLSAEGSSLTGAAGSALFGGVDLVRRMLSSSTTPPSVLH